MTGGERLANENEEEKKNCLMAYHINAGVLARVNILTNSIIQHFQTEQKATSSLFNANEKFM